MCRYLFFFNDTATTEIYTLSLHDALPISRRRARSASWPAISRCSACSRRPSCGCTGPRTTSCASRRPRRSEEHTSELQSRQYLVCRLLLEKKKSYHHSAKHASHIQSQLSF